MSTEKRGEHFMLVESRWVETYTVFFCRHLCQDMVQVDVTIKIKIKCCTSGSWTVPWCSSSSSICSCSSGLSDYGRWCSCRWSTRSAFCLIVWSGSWCSCGWLMQLYYFSSWLQEIPIGLDDFAYTVGGRVVHKTDDRSLFGSCSSSLVQEFADMG